MGCSTDVKYTIYTWDGGDICKEWDCLTDTWDNINDTWAGMYWGDQDEGSVIGTSTDIDYSPSSSSDSSYSVCGDTIMLDPGEYAMRDSEGYILGE